MRAMDDRRVATQETADAEPGSGATPDALPRRIAHYRIDGVLGRGGMGEVLAAFDEQLRRPVALKRLAGRESPEARARFWREARSLAALTHPGVVRVHAFGEAPDGSLYLAMERIEGRSLADLLDAPGDTRSSPPWPWNLSASLAMQLAEALGAAHAVGLVHRDVKPANVLVEASGRVRLVDFGLARTTDGAEDRVTRTGAVLGTPAYMAPEQLEGTAVGPQADVFALGVVLYRLLSGVHPFTRDSAHANALAVSTAKHQPLGERVPEVPETLAALVESCLALDSAARPADARAVAAALAEFAAPTAEVGAALRARMASTGVPVSPTPGAARGGSTPAQTGRPRFATPSVTLALLGAAMVAGFAVWATRPAPRDTTRPAAEVAPAGAATDGSLHRWPRPVVAVLGVETPQAEADDPLGAVFADALRVALDSRPEALVSVPLGALENTYRPETPIDAHLDATALVRTDGGPGHVDVVVRGLVTESSAGGLSLTLRLEPTRDRPEAGRVLDLTGPSDPLELARQAAAVLAETLGVSLGPLPASPTPSVSAWAAWLAARAALRSGRFEAAETSLDWALQLDPDFALAAAGRFTELRSRRDFTTLASEAAALESRLSDRHIAPALLETVQAFRAWGEGRPAEALKRFERVVAHRPFDVDTLSLQLALRFQDANERDLVEVERLARKVLAVAPRHETAASRLLRSLAFRGDVAAADSALAALDVPPDDAAFLEVFAEADLYAGRWASAQERFAQVLARSPGDVYAEHLAIATRLLSGDCPGAAVDALARIDRIEALDAASNLDWTYSLAVQALFCAEAWDRAESLFVRWSAHSASGREQVESLRPRAALAAGRGSAKLKRLLGKRWTDRTRPAASRPELARLWSRLETDVTALESAADTARSTSLDPATPGHLRAAWRRTEQTLSARALRLRGRRDEARSAYDRLATPLALVRNEGDLGTTVEGWVLRAEALEQIGFPAEAAAQWSAVRALGYPRLWVNDLWVQSRRETP
jgi:tetratricopeptide (TPR) repeat protein